jgi:phage baseplate assembly protein W
MSLFSGSDIVGPSLAADGTTRTVDDSEAIRQSLLSLLATRPGERVMRPLYGCDLYRLVFSPNDATTAGLAMHYARRAVERWEPRVTVVSVDARSAHETNLVVQLTYTRGGRNERESVSYTLQLAGGEP